MGEGFTASGPFSSGVVSAEGKGRFLGPGRSATTAEKGSRTGTAEGSGRGKGRGGSIGSYPVKKEQKAKSGADTDTLGTKKVKEEDGHADGGYISSDPDEQELGPKEDIENIINLISSDEEEQEGEGVKAKLRSYQATGLLPIRIRRREHVDRTMGINTDASSAGASKLGQSLGEQGQANSIETAQSKPRKGRNRHGEVEYLGDTRRFKGAWHDQDDEADDNVKEEPDEEDIDMAAVPPFVVPTAVMTEAAAPPGPTLKEPLSSPESKREAKAAINSRPNRKNFLVEQTQEDRQENARHAQYLATLVNELGTMEMNGLADQTADDDAAAAERVDKRTDRVYLFQLPPIVPDLTLADPPIKADPDRSPPANTDEHRTTLTQPSNLASPTPAPSTDPIKPVKLESGSNGRDSEEKAKGLATPTLTSGLAGKLRVHRSGRVTLDWGGTRMELKMGIDAKFLQSVACVDLLPEEERRASQAEGSRIGGEVAGLGQVMGKFVVCPDWGEILG